MDNTRGHILFICTISIVLTCRGQGINTGSVQQPRDLQTCVANMACNINYSNIVQAKLDNISHYTELEFTLLRYQMNGFIQPLQQRIDVLEKNQTMHVNLITKLLQTIQSNMATDRDSLNNLTGNLNTLKGDVHKENLQRYQDVNKLVLDLTDAKHQIANLQHTVNALVTNGNVSVISMATTNTGSSYSQSCLDKDKKVIDLQNNLTYYMNAFTSSQKTMENIRTLENFLQSQVVQLKANLSRVETANTIKDKLIVNLQQQLKTVQTNPAAVTVPRNCVGELGMRNGQIPSSAIVASESQSGHGPENSRLDNAQGWYTSDKEHSQDYLQIDTGSMHYITKVATQGAPCCDVMVTNYTLQYSNDGQTWLEYKQNCNKVYFSGNSDANTVVEHSLSEPIIGRFVRFHVENFRKNGQSNYVGMRVELYGCTTT